MTLRTVMYSGRRTTVGPVVSRITDTEHALLNPRLDLYNHSPTGFEWGYGGSGPAQLALAILADVLGDDARAVELHQEFKRDVVAALADDTWLLTAIQVHAWLAERGAKTTGDTE